MYMNYVCLHLYGMRQKIVLKTVCSVCGARRQRFPKNGVKRSVPFRSSVHSVQFYGPFRSVARSVPFHIFAESSRCLV